MAKHSARMPWWHIALLVAVCVLAAVSVAVMAVHLGRATPADGGISSSSSAVTTLLTTESTTTTTEAATTTTRGKYTTLTVTSHQSAVTTNEPFTVFRGTSDPDMPLYLNGQTVKRDAAGVFSVEMSLQPGKNTFTFSHQDKETVYTVTYNYIILQTCTPSGAQRYKSGATFTVSVVARVGSTATATFNGKTITLKQGGGLGGDEDRVQSDHFTTYSGSFTLPSGHAVDKNMGKVSFTVTCGGQTATAASGNIVCEKTSQPVIGEIVSFSAETFDGDTADDDSRPTNNYLPQGTVDYVVGRAYYGSKEYLKLRCGRRVYVKKTLSPTTEVVTVTKEYAGTLPSTNRLAVADVVETEQSTRLILDTEWKAPFLLDLLPQTYTDPQKQDYTVTEVTCEYVQITFCYATDLDGDIVFDPNHPLFTHAIVSGDERDTVLRLYLRRVGEFYGWDASYNEQGQLEFYFLHPAQATKADNAYGADLTGIRIMLDVGHGAKVVGAAGLDPKHPEGERNWSLAQLLKTELESMGATVLLNRDGKSDLNADQRCLALKNAKPNLCIAIHHDSNNSSIPNGFGSFHSTLFSVRAAQMVYDRTIAANLYHATAAGNRNRMEWHYYFVARMTDCPVVLTENGFMSSPLDHEGIVSDAVNRQKAKAIAQGVADYFLSIRIEGRLPLGTTTTAKPTTSTTVTTATTTVTTAITTETTTTTATDADTTDTTTTTTESSDT